MIFFSLTEPHPDSPRLSRSRPKRIGPKRAETRRIWGGGCNGKRKSLGCDTPSPFSERFPVRYSPPQKGYLSDTCAIPYENEAKRPRYPPLCDTISKGYCVLGGISDWAAKQQCSWGFQGMCASRFQIYPTCPSILPFESKLLPAVLLFLRIYFPQISMKLLLPLPS